ncbi:unnamed protein product [Heligmosomoides polygyrus]|uniref:Transposase n=1 Tax=Heligmosomoides polygyrus TaxID=6339 RepID=A0A183F9J2_HELPZ|nr:unnamed protein product [Heligmosomoides polygyrus]
MGILGSDQMGFRRATKIVQTLRICRKYRFLPEVNLCGRGVKVSAVKPRPIPASPVYEWLFFQTCVRSRLNIPSDYVGSVYENHHVDLNSTAFDDSKTC